MSAYIEAPADSPAVPPHTAVRRPRRPRWVRPAYWGTMALAALVYCYGLGQNGNANSYYAAAVLSGTKSWSAMFYGSLDAGNFITVDKPPFALWLMEISCRVFGFGSWQMLLPIAGCGIASVAVLYSAVRRSFGPVAASVSGVVLALTPITVAISRDNNPDPVLVLLTVSAAWFCLEAIRRGTLRHLVISAVLVGFAFNTKMLQAYMVIPALFLAYVWAGRGSWLIRVRNLLIAGVALVVSSGWWMVIVASIKDHPFIGSSSDGTVWNLVIGYNGLERVLGANAGNVTGSTAGAAGLGAVGRAGGGGGGAGGGGFPGGGGANFGGTSGAGRLFNDVLGGQISWLIPFAVVALVGALVLRGRRRRTDMQRASLLLWGMWLFTHYVVFSFSSGTFHPYYTTMLAPAIAALTGAGGTMLLRALRSPSRGPLWAAVLPAGVAVSAIWAVLLLRRTASFDPWLWPVVALLAIGGVAALMVARFGAASVAAAVRKRVLAVGAIAAALALVAGPAAYAADTVTAGEIQGTNPTAGPSSGEGFGGPGGGMRGGFPGGIRGGEFPGGAVGTAGGGAGEAGGATGFGGRGGAEGAGGFGGGFPGGTSSGVVGGSTGPSGASGSSGTSGLGGFPGGMADGMPGGMSGGTSGGTERTRGFGGAGGFGGPMGGGAVSSALLSYLEKNQGGATWLVAVSSAQSASEMILQSGKPVIAMGGFTGSDPAMSLARLKSLVASGKLRYVLLDSGTSGGMGGGPGGGGQANSQATSYVKSTCTAVSASAYGGSSSTSSSSSTSAGTATAGGDSATAARSASSGETLYECTA
ncbi:glycosyltransferase family 39 protein [Streptacidiphilus neutrinimicus]|uniref:glycosyltransferase family 39 protein n=1 Tax=Streptacidiphilus neutrinimicus TaxID=105420 RepID=UPI0007C7BE65|nr:glycosyltransferase family 39 protein [Streptacidiphilus neutrinimicus]